MPGCCVDGRPMQTGHGPTWGDATSANHHGENGFHNIGMGTVSVYTVLRLQGSRGWSFLGFPLFPEGGKGRKTSHRSQRGLGLDSSCVVWGALGLKSSCFGVAFLPLGHLGWWPLMPRVAPWVTNSFVRARAGARPQPSQVLPPKRNLGAGEGVRPVEKWLGRSLPQVGLHLLL